MKLAINTSHPKQVRVEVSSQGSVVREMIEENEFGSQVLLPLIMQLLDTCNLDLGDLTSIEVNTGPGSYTGLKVGASVAQALGFALNIPVNGKLNKPVKLQYT